MVRFSLRSYIGLCLSLLALPVSALAADSFSQRIPLYAASSKLSSGKWVKLRVAEDGVYKVTFSELKSLGFSNPEKVRVFGYGGNLLSETLTADYKDDLPEVNSYLGNSYILFYGVGSTKFSYVASSGSFTVAKSSYSDYGYYFLSDVEGSRRSFATEKAAIDSSAFVNRTHRKPVVYYPAKSNPYNGGTIWYDTPIVHTGTKTVTFPVPNMVKGDYCNASFSLQVMDAGTNDKNATELTSGSSSFSTFSTTGKVTNFEQPASNSLSFDFDFTSSCSTGKFYLQYLLAAPLCNNKLYNGYLHFNNVGISGTSDNCRMVVSNTGSSTLVWNVTNPQDVTVVSALSQGDSTQFLCETDAFTDYVAFNPDATGFLSVDSFYTVGNQDLHAQRGADLVIVSPAAFASEAQELANLHAANDGISSVIVSPAQIYNEFSSGTPDPTAIRAYMKMLYDRAQDDEELVAPRYLLLFGDGCFDNRGVLASSYSSTHNFIPVYLTAVGSNNYPADGYYGMLADNTSNFDIRNASAQVGVGRLPVVSASQAEDVVSKISAYMQNKYYGSWKSKALILADDNESGATSSSQYHEFVINGERLSDTISLANPDVVQKKVYYDAYSRVSESSGFRYIDVENAILDNIADGTMFINYIGHSNSVNWSAEKTFTQNKVASLTNKKLGVWLSASCEFAEYDNYGTSCAESLLLSANGGAIAVVATPRMVYASSNQLFDAAFAKYFFSQSEGETLGDILRKTINQVRSNDIRVKFPLLGDPALRIVFPSTGYKVITDSLSSDTVRAMQKVTVKGHIGTASEVLSTFNGNVDITVYDKQQLRSTKGNANSKWVYQFKDYPTVLYAGNAEVNNGEFSFSFIVPGDIAYNYGNGRIAYYASDEADSIDVIGSTSSFVVGGMCDSIASDSVGPTVRCYINSTAFRSGDVVGSNPVFIAEVNDENGINAAGVGIGHDITVSLNGADNEIVNSSFSYSARSCTDGKVVYQLSDLADGVYTLTFKVWDLLNNSTTQTITFKVENGLSPHVDNMVAVAASSADEAVIKVNYDRPLADVSYKLGIYDLQGHLLWQEAGSDNNSDGQLSLPWNYRDAAGRRVEPGVYVYRVDLKTKDSDYVGNSEKIMVLPQ